MWLRDGVEGWMGVMRVHLQTLGLAIIAPVFIVISGVINAVSILVEIDIIPIIIVGVVFFEVFCVVVCGEQ